MSISNTVRTAGPFACNGSTTVFPFTFKVFSASEVTVALTDASGNLTTLILATDYTVTLNANQDSSPGGSITTLATYAAGYTITLTSNVQSVQPVVLTNGGGFYPDVLNDAFDRLTILAQQLERDAGRSLKVPVGETSPSLQSLASANGTVLGILGGQIVPVPNTSTGLEQMAADLAAQLATIGVFLAANQYRVSIARATWAELNGIVGSANQTAVVPTTDTGTHSDNVTSGHPTVPNSGIYRYSTSPAGWQWLTAAETAASGLTATSDTNLVIGTGAKTFTLNQSGKAFVAGMNVIAYSSAGYQMAGTVSSYTPSSGNLVLNITATVGSGSQRPWNIFLSGPSGLNGSNGTNGTNGLSAYDIAVAAGYVGTQAQWLASLQAQSTTNAQTAATAAQAAQTAAENARDASLGAYHSFYNRYLGSYAADPTVDNDGNALVVGARYWNSTSNVLKTYSGSSWIADIGVIIDTDGALTANSDSVVSSQKAVKTYVDGKVAGLSWKQAVRAATTAAGTLATSFANGQAIDGVTLVTGDRILVKNQATASENGIYVVNASGAPTRATDADSGAELVNASVYASEGTTQADTQWTCTTNAPITPGTTSLAFAQFGVQSGTVTYVKNTADQTTTSATLVDITGLAFTPAANTTYEIEALIPCTNTASVNAAFLLGVAWSTGLTFGYASIEYTDSDGTNANNVTQGTSAASFSASLRGATTIRLAKVFATISVGASPSGTFKMQFGANGTATATIKNGSYLRYRAI
ncbi:hypothetical protein UFOVP152_7 [uncultured Caudovirales phage]|uniref:Tail fiber protein n=1 Tax=uncultured Caudovirales phage TaxID=2100421 RepID=A0A6J7W857_9CAUD|nr:hypothetical protein UFOVP152_7 [uncultured Caudovirales phage]